MPCLKAISTRTTRLLVIGVAVVSIALSVVAGVAPASATTSSSGTLRIAYFTDALSNVYLTTATAAAQKVAKKAGVEMDVFNGNFSSATQLTQIQDAIASGKYNAMVVEAVDGAAVCKPLLAASAQGMIVSIFNAPICGNARTLYTKGTIGYFGGNDYEYGQIAGKQIIKALGGKGTVASVTGPVASTIVQTTEQGLVDELKTAPGISLVAEEDGEWDAADGLTATQDIVQAHPDISGIVYGVDQMAIPSIKYLASDGKIKSIKIVSLGATTNAAAAIRAGDMYAGVIQLPAQESAYAVTAAIQTFHKKPIDVPGWDAKTKIYNLITDPSLKGNPVIDKANVNVFKPEWSV
jgi:ribose transport system substrate-binding protein